jgi:hypothetical protein
LRSAAILPTAATGRAAQRGSHPTLWPIRSTLLDQEQNCVLVLLKSQYGPDADQADESPPGSSVLEIPSFGRESMTRVADAMLCLHDVVLGKELTFLCPAPRALRLVQFLIVPF